MPAMMAVAHRYPLKLICYPQMVLLVILPIFLPASNEKAVRQRELLTVFLRSAYETLATLQFLQSLIQVVLNQNQHGNGRLTNEIILHFYQPNLPPLYTIYLSLRATSSSVGRRWKTSRLPRDVCMESSCRIQDHILREREARLSASSVVVSLYRWVNSYVTRNFLVFIP